MKNLNQIAYLLLFCLVCSFQVNAQSIVSGSVSNAEGPIKGVAIFIKGTNNGTQTDERGKYSIKTKNSKTDVLVFSALGYKTEEIAVKGKNELNVVLQQTIQDLNEVVVIGYGTNKKSHLTGAISKIEGDKLLDVPTSDITTALQGRLSGVSINNITSEVGVEPQVRVRGVGSISADATPLIVVDGYPIEGGLQTINQNDIASIEILKDASSSAIYGSRAANGVILITTKVGNTQKPSYSLRTYAGAKSAYKLHPMMSYNEYVDQVSGVYWNANNSGVTTRYNDLAAAWLERQLGATDWQEIGLQNAYTTSAQLGISGGKDATKYYISAGYVKDDGLIVQNYNNKFNTRIKLDTRLSRKVNIGVNFSGAMSSSARPRNNFIDYARFPYWIPARHNEFTSALTGRPVGSYSQPRDFNITSAVYPIGLYKDTDGNWVPDLDANGDQVKVGANPYNSQNNNPAAILDGFYQEAKAYQGVGNMYFNWEPIKGLVLSTSNGFNLRYRADLRYIYANASKDGEPSQALQRGILDLDWLSENTAKYKKSIGKHDFDLLAGFTAGKTTTDYSSLNGFGFPTDYVYTLNAATEFGLVDANGNMTTGSRRDSKGLASVLGRINYSYADRYLLSVAFRTDGSSLFGAKRRWASFPSVSAGWRLSEEDFMKKINWLTNLKLRGGYGITGNNKIPYNANINVYSGSNYSFGTGNGNLYTGLSFSSNVFGNEYLTWEQTEEWNGGLDLGLVKNRISLTVDAYYSKTKSLLFKRPMQSFTGFTQSWANIGKIRNKGLEITLETANIDQKTFKWSTTANISFTRNRLLELGGEYEIITTGYNKERYVNRVGSPAVQFYGYKTKGVIIGVEDPNNPGTYILPQGTAYWDAVNTKPGQLDIVDVNPDGVIDERDMTVLGNPYPDFTYGLTNTFKFKGIDLSFLIQGVQGGSIVNAEMSYNDMYRRNKSYGPELSWMSNTVPGDGIHPSVLSNGAGGNWMQTDYVIQDASYLCLRNVTAGYAFNKKVVKKLGIAKMRVYATANNLFYWMPKSYWGINPEYRNTSSPYDSPLVGGYQRGAFPVISTYTLGLDIGF